MTRKWRAADAALGPVSPIRNGSSVRERRAIGSVDCCTENTGSAQTQDLLPIT